MTNIADVIPEGGEDELLVEVRDAAAVRDVIRCCRRRAPHATLITADGSVHAVRLLRGSETGVALELGGAAREGPCGVRVQFYGVLFELRGRLKLHERRYELCGPLRLYSLDRRSVSRQILPEGRAELSFSIPDAHELRIGHSTVRDLTPTGAGIVATEPEALPRSFFPAALRVGDTTIACLAVLRRAARAPGDTAGIELRPASLGAGLIEAYMAERWPELQPRTSIDPGALRDLMRHSGYLSLRGPSVRFARWHQLGAKGLCSCDRVYRAADGSLLAHGSVTRIYRKTWLLHQLATLGGHAESGRGRAALYQMAATVPLLYDGSQARVIAYFNQDISWHVLFFKRFADWVGNPALAAVCSFDRFERATPRVEYRMPAGCEVREARPDELLEATALVRAQLPELTADAFDIHPGDLVQPAPRRSDRGRSVFVLREGGLLAGVALCEVGNPDLSLFNLVNIAQIYIRKGARRPSRDAQRSLIARARAFYAERHVRRPLIVSPAETFDSGAEPETYRAESMGCIAIAGGALRQWENFCRFQFGQRWRRHG